MKLFRTAFKLTDAQRRIIAGLAVVLTMTSTRVQAAEANAVLPQAPQWETGQVVQNDASDQGIILPKSLNGSLEGAQNVPVIRVSYATITAYASVPGETDDSPFITADGSHVADGIVSANWLPFGTKIRIPQLSGDKVYVVHDRMNRRFSDRVDVWVSSVAKESTIGLRKNYKIEIL